MENNTDELFLDYIKKHTEDENYDISNLLNNIKKNLNLDLVFICEAQVEKFGFFCHSLSDYTEKTFDIMKNSMSLNYNEFQSISVDHSEQGISNTKINFMPEDFKYSTIHCMISDKGKMIGTAGFISLDENKVWTDSEKDTLRKLSRVAKYQVQASRFEKVDFERQKKIEKALSDAEKANYSKSVFLSNMSHDIRTPMNAILGFTDIAEKNIDDKEKVKDCLSKIQSSGEHLLSLINDVLDMSQIESGKMFFEDKIVSVNEEFEKVKAMFSEKMSEKNLEFITSVDVDHDVIITDSLRVNQVLVNVISNAYKYTKPGGRVEVSITQKAKNKKGLGKYEFVVKDTGIGMSKDFQRQIFDAFAREQTSTLSGIKGTGLGMSITKKIVDAFGGSIKISSKLGEGTTVKICMDFLISKEENKKKSEETKKYEDLRGIKVLLVEDNELNREIAVELLSEMGFFVDIAEDGSVAVDKVMLQDAGSYDIILMDIQMPYMDGYTATQIIRNISKPEKASIPIIAMTANAFEEDKKKALAAGMDAHVSKPLDINLLLDAIAENVGKMHS